MNKQIIMNIKRNSLVITALHIMAWAVLFSLPYFLAGNTFRTSFIFQNTWIPLSFYAFIFYFNYFFLIDKFLFKKKNIPFFLLNTLLILVLVLTYNYIKQNFFAMDFPKNGIPPPKKFFYYLDSISFVVPLVFSISLKFSERWKETENLNKEAEKIKLESELTHLKYQLQPHFFFNSLNTIYSLIDIDPDSAKTTIHTLGKLMRYLLYGTNTEQVTLNSEIEFIKSYIDLMKLRSSDKTEVHYSFPEFSESKMIEPLLFIALVENAFKHGISSTENSNIDFKMSLNQNTLTLLAVNTHHPKNKTDESGSGIGLANLEKRLSLLYGSDYTFTQEIRGNYYTSTLALPID
ncbi:MAG: histidine kinase [Leeuwenhoekiella sp.]